MYFVLQKTDFIERFCCVRFIFKVDFLEYRDVVINSVYDSF